TCPDWFERRDLRARNPPPSRARRPSPWTPRAKRMILSRKRDGKFSSHLERIDVDRPAHLARLAPAPRVGNEVGEQRAKRRPLPRLEQELHAIASPVALHRRRRGPEHLDMRSTRGRRANARGKRGDRGTLGRFRAPQREMRERRPARAPARIEREL